MQLAPLDRRVLVVDDDLAIRELISARLAVQQLRVLTASDGLEALERIREFQPHALILDINMPNLDGFNVMGRLGTERMAALPTLVLTARHGADDVHRAIALGARDYLSKPFADAQLLSRVARLMRLRPGRILPILPQIRRGEGLDLDGL